MTLVFYVGDHLIGYFSWKNLTFEEIEQKAKGYARRDTPICLYVVECKSGTPKLRLVSNGEKINTDDLKEVIWKRRFYGYCEGKTENIAIDFPDRFKKQSDARWSFSMDDFITNNGHFQGSFMSSEPWEKCTRANVTWK